MNEPFRRTWLEPALYLRFAGGMPSVLGVVQYSYDLYVICVLVEASIKPQGKTPVGKAFRERVSSFRNHFVVLGRPRLRLLGAGSSPVLRSYSLTSEPASKLVAGSQESSAGENPFHRT